MKKVVIVNPFMHIEQHQLLLDVYPLSHEL